MDKPRLCVTVTASTTGELRARRDAVRDADLVELRLDSVADPDPVGALEGRRLPVIVTCRPRWEGGSFAGSEEERHRLLAGAIELGADYVDLEWRAGFDDLIRRRDGRGVVLSMHDFVPPRRDLADRVHAMWATGAETVKVAVSADRLADLVPLLAIAQGQPPRRQGVYVAMGRAGLPTRVLAARFGSAWTYAGDLMCVGQIGSARLLGDYRFRDVRAGTAVYGVVGRPVSHSLSPALHNAGFAAESLDAVYLPLEAADAGDFVTFAEAAGLAGASVTAPFKQHVLARLDEVDSMVRSIGAVNTIRMDGRRWIGRNTDVEGFLVPLRARLDPAGLRVAVLGAGGAARSVGYALVTAGARVTIHARRQERAALAATAIGAASGGLPPPSGSWDILVNATPVGTAPEVDQRPIDGAPFDGTLVYDLVYNPRRTRLLAEAERAGLATIGGLPMLVAQAELQFEWWTGRRPPDGLFGRVADARLRERETQEGPR